MWLVAGLSVLDGRMWCENRDTPNGETEFMDHFVAFEVTGQEYLDTKWKFVLFPACA
jgi:hypothetical protein